MWERARHLWSLVVAVLFVCLCLGSCSDDVGGGSDTTDSTGVVVDDGGSAELDCGECTTDNPCLKGQCDTARGTCGYIRANEGKACDDGSVCTSGEACADGVCKGAAKKCDDVNPCTADSCDFAKGCQYSPDDANVCDDGSKCTIGDTCAAGKCKPGEAKDCPSSTACAASVCDAQTGACGFENRADGKACDDKDGCTTKDTCVKGACAGSPKKCDDSNNCTNDACEKDKGCQHTAAKGGCDDGDKCTVGDVCKDTACEAGSAKMCDDANPCTQDTCTKETGVCLSAAATASCDDGSKCTKDDACAGSKCSGKPVSCDDNNACTNDGCDATKGCTHAATSGACDDGDSCTEFDTCAAKKCQGKAKDGAKACDDDNPCTTDSCGKDKGCSHVANAASCDDGNKCTVGDVCKATKCVAGKNTCGCTKTAECKAKDDANACNGTLICAGNKCVVDAKTVITCDTTKDSVCSKNICAPSTGECALKVINEAKSCDADGSTCTVGDACLKGTCTKGKARQCDDKNPCTDDSCDAKKGCVNAANKAACDDGKKCTVADTCKGKICAPGKPKVCNDGNSCTVDTCAATTGMCTVKSKLADGAACDADGSVCTPKDACKSGACEAAEPVVCDDGKVCTKDLCDLQKGCKAVPLASDATCDKDGNPCTLDICAKGGCAAGKPKICADKPCTTASCDKKTGACATKVAKDGAVCDASTVYCSVGDTCKAGKCEAGATKTCADGNACTDDFCGKNNGCYFPVNNAPCSDADQCSQFDVCQGGKCKAGPQLTCNDGDKCTTDSCSAKKGCAFAPITGCVSKKKGWTVLVYMAADNNLEASALEDLGEMLKVSGSDNLRFIIQIDRHKDYDGAGFGHLAGWSSTKRLQIMKGKLKEIADLGELNTGDPKVLSDFITWGLTTYPADREMLVLWNHGHAWLGFGGDDQANKDLLLPAEISSGVANGLKGAGKKQFSMIGFDACLMGSLTTAMLMREHTRYLIASEDLEPGHGWNYRGFDTVAEAPNTPLPIVGQRIIDSFAKQAKQKRRDQSITLAVLDLHKLQAVIEQFGALVKKVDTDLSNQARAVGVGRSRVQSFGRSPDPKKSYHMVDLGDFAKQLSFVAPTVAADKDKLLQALDKLVLYRVAGRLTKESTGLSVYFPPHSTLYRTAYDGIDLMKVWIGLMKNYFKLAKGEVPLPGFAKGDGGGGDSKGGLPPSGQATKTSSDNSGGDAGTNPFGGGKHKPTKGKSSATTTVTVPWVEKFDCNGSWIDHWEFKPVNGAATKARWSVDNLPSPPTLAKGCALNFNDDVAGYDCKAGETIEADVLSPWIAVPDIGELTSANKSLINIELALLGKWPDHDKLSIFVSSDGQNWQNTKPLPDATAKGYYWNKTSPLADDIDQKIGFADGFNGKKFRLRIRFKAKCGYKGPGPFIKEVRVLNPENPCKLNGAGTWCVGDTQVQCNANKQLVRKKSCAFGCGGEQSGKGECKGEVVGLAGKVTVTCTSGGAIQIQARLKEGAVDHVAKAELHYGFVATRGDFKGTYVLGRLPATVSPDGRITAAWDQRILVAQHSGGTTALYSKRYSDKEVEIHEVPLQYRRQSTCPCLDPSDKGYTDADSDGWADCDDTDVDDDGLLNDKDNCKWIANPDQKDSNKDGIGDACNDLLAGPKADFGAPSPPCKPVPYVEDQDAIWHVTLAAGSGERLSAALYSKLKYGISEVRVEKGVRLTPSIYDPSRNDFNADDGNYIKGEDVPSVKFVYRSIDQLIAYGKNIPIFTKDFVPVLLKDWIGLNAIYLELRVENFAGKGDSVIYKGPAPYECVPPPLKCTQTDHIPDCLGQCKKASWYSDNVCDKGQLTNQFGKITLDENYAHFKCEWANWDGGDCSTCPKQDEMRDCQGYCHKKKTVYAGMKNGTCEEGLQMTKVGGKDHDLNCAAFFYDGASCSSSDKKGGGDCLNDCSKHGKCTNGGCECDSGYLGVDCSLAQPKNDCCTKSKGTHCKQLSVAACVCQIDNKCCTKAWGEPCAKLAQKYCSCPGGETLKCTGHTIKAEACKSENKSSSDLSCASRCGTNDPNTYLCQCDATCSKNSNCCADYDTVCKTSTKSCADRCGTSDVKKFTCQCDAGCSTSKDCCGDYDKLCKSSGGTCANRCGTVDAMATCQCDTKCGTNNNCCTDYAKLCKSSDGTCANRCGTSDLTKFKCQCDSGCTTASDCCKDYATLCKKGG